MKDLKLPMFSREYLDKAYSELKVGDSLVRIKFNVWARSNDLDIQTVLRITPKGYIRLSNKELLKGSLYGYIPITEEVREYINKVNLEKKLLNLMYKTYSNYPKIADKITYDQAKLIVDILSNLIREERQI